MAEGSPPKKRTKQDNNCMALELPDELLSGQSNEISNGPTSINISSSAASSSTSTLPSSSSAMPPSILSPHVPSSQINNTQILLPNDKPAIPPSPSNSMGSPHPGRQQPQPIASTTIVKIPTPGSVSTQGGNFGNNKFPTEMKPQIRPTTVMVPNSMNSIQPNTGFSSNAIITQHPNHGANTPSPLHKSTVPFQSQIQRNAPIQISQGGVPGISTVTIANNTPFSENPGIRTPSLQGRISYPNAPNFSYNPQPNNKVNQTGHMQIIPSGPGIHQTVDTGSKFQSDTTQRLDGSVPYMTNHVNQQYTPTGPSIRNQGPSRGFIPFGPRGAPPSRLRLPSVPTPNTSSGPRIPGGSTPSVDPEKRKLIQQQLFLLLHAHKCAKSENAGEASECTVVHCRTMKSVLRHMNVCQDGKQCQVAHCASSRQIIAHWKQCKRQDCSVCHPLKSPKPQNPPSIGRPTPGNSEEGSISSLRPPNSNKLTQNEVRNVLGLTPALKPPADASSIIGIGNARPVAGTSQSVNTNNSSESPEVVPPRVAKPWHIQVDGQLRNYLVQKLVKNIFPKPDKVAATDNRMIKLLAFARKVEGSMYEQANSRIEYLHLLAEKIYKIQKELEEKRKIGSRNSPKQPPSDGNSNTKPIQMDTGLPRPITMINQPNVHGQVGVTEPRTVNKPPFFNGNLETSKTIMQFVSASKAIAEQNNGGPMDMNSNTSQGSNDAPSSYPGSTFSTLPPVSTVNSSSPMIELDPSKKVNPDGQTMPTTGGQIEVKTEPVAPALNTSFSQPLLSNSNNIIARSRQNNQPMIQQPPSTGTGSRINQQDIKPDVFTPPHMNFPAGNRANSTPQQMKSSFSGPMPTHGNANSLTTTPFPNGDRVSQQMNPSSTDSAPTEAQDGGISVTQRFQSPSTEETGNRIQTFPVTPGVKPATPKSKTAIVPNKVFTKEEMIHNLLPVWEKMMELDPESGPFREPVDPIRLGIPDYFDVVKHPMDLSTIRQNLDEGKFTEPWQFISAVWLMFQNAWLYNRKTSKVYKFCTRLKEVFEVEIDPVMRKLGYCCGRKLEFSPMTLCCYGKSLCTIPTGAVYFSYQNSPATTGLDAPRYDFCEKCYKDASGDHVKINDEAGQAKQIPKSELVKKKNDVLDPELFVYCTECGRKMHQICVLHHHKIWPDKYVCGKCHNHKGTSRKPNRYTAEKLPQNRMSEHIEKRVNEYLRKNDTQSEAGYVHIRCVYSGEKSVEVKPGMKRRFVDTKEMPESFPYKSKAFFAFQQLEGKEVCFFGVHVQEYGNSLPPNQKRVYLSYLDSVHFFRPRHLRTAVYHEILIGYLHYCRTLGFEHAHIWACPPSEGDDYIFHCHPPEQKIPKPKRLQEWYKKMLDKAVVDQVIHSFNDIYKQAKEDRLQFAREIPYFDGDFWPNIIEDSIKEVEQEEEDRKQAVANEQAAAEEGQASVDGQKKQKIKKGNKKASQRSAKKKIPQVSSGLSDKLYQVMEKHREVFFVIRLQTAESVSKIGPINDPDPLIPCELMDGRDTFLTSARENHYEFSSLRRAIYSTMCLTYDLHVSSQDFMYTCNNCKANVETRYHCVECEDFDLCKTCYQRVGHEHKMDQIGLGIDMGGSGPRGGASNPRNESVQRVIASLKHASQCKNANCNSVQCRQMKKVLHHAKSCRRTTQTSNCTVCRRLIVLCIYHAKHCTEPKCVVPFCNSFRMKFRYQEKENRRRQSQLLARRVAYMTNGASDRANTEAMSSNMSGNSCAGDVANKAPRTPQQMDQPLTPSQGGNMNDPGTPGSQHGPGTPNQSQTMMKPAGMANSPHRRISHPAGSKPLMGSMGQPNMLQNQLLNPVQPQLGGNKNFPYNNKSSEKARMAANQAKVIAAKQALPNAAGLPHNVQGYQPILPGKGMQAQWNRGPNDPNFVGKVVVSAGNSPGVQQINRTNFHPTAVNIRAARNQKPGSSPNVWNAQGVVRATKRTIMRTDDINVQQPGTVIPHSQVSIASMSQAMPPNQTNMSMSQNSPMATMAPWPKRMRHQIPQDQYYNQQPMGSQRMMTAGPVNPGQKLIPQQQFSLQQPHRLHNQPNPAFNQLMQQPHQSPGMPGNNQQMMNSNTMQLNQQAHSNMMTSPVMNTGNPQAVGGMLQPQQNSGNLTPAQGRLPQMSPGNMVHNNNLTGPSNQMDQQHFNQTMQQQQAVAAQSQGNMMGGMNAFNRSLQINNRPVHSNINYSVNPQGNNQQTEMLNSSESIDKFMGSSE